MYPLSSTTNQTTHSYLILEHNINFKYHLIKYRNFTTSTLKMSYASFFPALIGAIQNDDLHMSQHSTMLPEQV